jgi:hypothetical protein
MRKQLFSFGMKKSVAVVALIAVVSVWGAQKASAAVTAVNIGTGNPPGTLGGYTMTPFDPGHIAGQLYYAHETNGNYDGGGTGVWNTWGQNYTGNVYAAAGGATLMIDLTGPTQAVDFYEEPQQYANFDMTATDSSGATVTTLINGNHGSAGVGFYEDGPGVYLTQISVTASDPTGYAVGEFGISGGTLGGSLPEPMSMSLLLVGAGPMLMRRRPLTHR